MTSKKICSGVQNLHCNQQDCLHHAEHEPHETCEQTFCSLKRTTCYCYEQAPATEPVKRATKPVKKPYENCHIIFYKNLGKEQSFAERLAQLLQKR